MESTVLHVAEQLAAAAAQTLGAVDGILPPGPARVAMLGGIAVVLFLALRLRGAAAPAYRGAPPADRADARAVLIDNGDGRAPGRVR